MVKASASTKHACSTLTCASLIFTSMSYTWTSRVVSEVRAPAGKDTPYKKWLSVRTMLLHYYYRQLQQWSVLIFTTPLELFTSAAMPAETSVGATEVAASNGIAHVVAPSAAVYLPVSQSVHAALPAPALNLPAAQSTHAPPSGPVEPALQMHADAPALSAGEKELAGHASHVVLAVAPSAAEYLPASQSMHAALPAPTLNLPAAQSTHAPPSGPVEPALQMHADAAALSAGEKELAGHASHVVLALAPSAAEYLPATYWLEGIQGKAKP